MFGFLTKIESVYRAVQKGLLNVSHVNFCVYSGRPVAQAVSSRTIRVGSQIIPTDICGGRSAVKQGFKQIIRVSPVSIIPTVLHTILYPHVAPSRKTNGRNLGTFQKPMFLRKSGNIRISPHYSETNVMHFLFNLLRV
jgi:hypothetical protein